MTSSLVEVGTKFLLDTRGRSLGRIIVLLPELLLEFFFFFFVLFKAEKHSSVVTRQ